MWLENFQKENPNAKSQKSQLRAYALWHEFGQDVDTVCRIWRDPPLKVSTVTSYIAEAIRLDKLPFEQERLREVLSYMAPMIKVKYVHLLKDGKEAEKPKIVRLD